MRTHFRTPVFSGACAVILFASLATLDAQMSRLYVRADAGGTLTSDTQLKSFFGEPLAPDTKVKFDPGVRFNIAGGMHVTEWFAAEFETGVMANNIRSISGATRIDDATFSNVPFFVNVRLQCPTRYAVSPYIGGGSGLSVAAIHADHLEIGGTSVHGDQADAVFGYQGFAGLRFRLNEQMGLSVEYHYFGTTEPSWEAENISGRMKFGRTETHAVSLAFDFRF